MWPSFYVCVISMYMCGKCVCVCLHAISGGKSEKVLAPVTKLSYTSVRCNICSSVTVNKGGNTSNIMKHLLTKYNMQCAVFNMSPGSHIHIEFRSRDTALIHNHKSTLFTCALV